MSVLSDYLEVKLLELMFKDTAFSPPANLYVGLFTTDPGESGVSGEFTIGVGAYARAVIVNNIANFPPCPVIGTPTKICLASIAWPTATTAWGTAAYWAIYDAASAGNMIAHGPLEAAVSIAIGDTRKIAPNGLVFTRTNVINGGLTDYATRKLLDHAFGASVYARPTTIYTGLGLELSGETLNEWGDSSYSRRATAFAAATSGAGTIANSASVQYTTGGAVGDAGLVITHYGIWDDGTSGNLLAVGPVNTPRSVAISDSVDLAAGDCVITLQ